MSLGWKIVGAVVVIGFVVGSIRHEFGHRAFLSDARKEAQQARQDAADALEQASAERSRAQSAQLAADNERRAAEKLADEANRLDAEAGRLEVALKAALAQAPDTCAELAQLAAAAIVSEQAISARWRSAYERSLQSYDSLHAAFVLADSALDRVVPATKELVRASDRLEKASRKSFFSRLTPKAQYGAMAGIDPFGRPNVVIGVGLGWSL